MKGEILFEKMTGISDEYVMEAALVTPVTAESGKKRRVSSLSTVWRRGLSAACICLIVAITAVAGLVAWAPIRDFIEQGNPPSGRFTFYYQTDTPGSKYCTALPGDTVSVDTGLQNEGKAFEASNFFARAYFVLQSDPSVVLEGEPYPLNEEAHAAVRTIKRGYRENMPFTFIIPEDAVLGVYDLVLSYGEEQQVYKGVLTVGEIDTEGETYPPISTDHAFSFGYEAADAVVQPGGRTSISCWTVNDGAAFTYTGYPDKYAPTAYLLHRESSYVIRGTTAPIEYDGQETITIMTGEIAGKVSYVFSIPADAPTGEYELVLSCLRNKQSFEGVLTVAEPTVEAPAVLSNLTMPVGSEWLYEPIDEAYVPGELVTVRFKCVADMEPLLILNEAFVEATAGDEQTGYLEYSFYMPDEDSEIYFYTYDRTLPYAAMLESCIAWDHYNFSEKEFYYYGQTEKGVMVALLLGNGEAVTRTNVGNYQFITPTTHDMLAYYNGGLYRLRIAYEDYELLTEEDLADLFAMHRSLFPDCYVDMPSPK